VIGYSNFDFVGCVNTRKFNFSYIYLLARGTILRKSTKQSVIVSSTMKVDFVTCFEGTF